MAWILVNKMGILMTNFKSLQFTYVHEYNVAFEHVHEYNVAFERYCTLKVNYIAIHVNADCMHTCIL